MVNSGGAVDFSISQRISNSTNSQTVRYRPWNLADLSLLAHITHPSDDSIFQIHG